MVGPKKTAHDFQMSNFVKRCNREKQQLRTKVSLQLATDLQRLLDDGQHADLQVHVSGEVLPVHICLLKQRAPWLYEWLGLPGPGTTKVSSDVKAKTLRQILKSIYTEDNVSDCQRLLEQDLGAVSNATTDEGCGLITDLPAADADCSKVESLTTPDSDSVTTPGSEDSGGWDVHCRLSSGDERVPEKPATPEACSPLGASVLEMFLNQKDTDVIIEVQDTTFEAHRCVLCARCEYFSAMLAGGWRESGSHHVKLQGVSAATLHQCLLYIYGGACSLLPETQLPELITASDMYGLEGLRDITTSVLRMDYCHFFHKPCEGCLTGVLDTVQLTHTYGPADLNQQCCCWITKYLLRVWPTKRFASLPPDVLSVCSAAAISEVNNTNALEMAMACDKVMDSLPRVKWRQVVVPMVTALRDFCIKHVSLHMAPIITSYYFRKLVNTMAMGLGVLEDVLCQAVDMLPPDKACDSYVAWEKMSQSVGSELCDWTEEFQTLVQTLAQRCKHYMAVHINQVVGTEAWVELPPETQKQIREGAGFVAVGDLNTKCAAPPKIKPRTANSSFAKKTTTANNPSKARPKTASNPQSKSSRKPVNLVPERAGSSSASGRPTTGQLAKNRSANSTLRVGQKTPAKCGASSTPKQPTHIPGLSHKSTPLPLIDSPSSLLVRKQSADALCSLSNVCGYSVIESNPGDGLVRPCSALDEDAVSMCSFRAVKGSICVSMSDIGAEDWSEAVWLSDSVAGSQWPSCDPLWECPRDFISWELTAPIHFAQDVLVPLWTVTFLDPDSVS